MLTARASGFTPLSIMPTHVASVSLSSFVLSSCDISYRAVLRGCERACVRTWCHAHSLSRVCCAEEMRSDSLSGMS